MEIRTLSREELAREARENSGGDAGYVLSVLRLYERAKLRGDGVAVYENHDLGHPEIGEKQYATFGSTLAQLETRHTKYFPSTSEQLGLHKHGDDFIPRTLPDIGGRINWRYQLVAVAT